MPQPTPVAQSAPLKAIERQTPDTMTLHLGLYMDFKAGQAIQVMFPGDAKKRFYSLSSSPTEKGEMAITVKADATNPLSAVLSKLKVGDFIEVAGPFGSFTLPDTCVRPLTFLAAGSGVTCFRSMIKSLLDKKEDVELWLFHSVKTPTDLIFQKEFSDWTQQTSVFHYIPTVTRSSDPSWHQETGRVTDTLLRKHLVETTGTYFLCGPPAFVADMESMLKDRLRVPVDQIRREQW